MYPFKDPFSFCLELCHNQSDLFSYILPHSSQKVVWKIFYQKFGIWAFYFFRWVFTGSYIWVGGKFRVRRVSKQQFKIYIFKTCKKPLAVAAAKENKFCGFVFIISNQIKQKMYLYFFFIQIYNLFHFPTLFSMQNMFERPIHVTDSRLKWKVLVQSWFKKYLFYGKVFTKKKATWLNVWKKLEALCCCCCFVIKR